MTAAAGHGWLTAALERLEKELVVPVRVVREAVQLCCTVLQRPTGAAAAGAAAAGKGARAIHAGDGGRIYSR